MKAKILVKIGEKALDRIGPIGAALAKHAPAIFTGLGVASLVGSNVASGWATLKAKEIMEEDISEIPEEERKRAALGKLAKVAGYYAPAVVATGLGVGLVVKGHMVQGDRLSKAMAAYSALSTSVASYRAAVEDAYGSEEEELLWNGAKKVKTDTYDVPEDGGKPKKHKTTVVMRGKKPGSPYATIFDDVSRDWTNNRENNLYFLKCQNAWANDRLRRRGYLFLNEVLESLDLPYNPAGQFVGWIDEAYEGSRDGIVDFGIQWAYLEEELELAQAEGRNPEPSIWLDFNVDGEIWNHIPLVQKQMR